MEKSVLIDIVAKALEISADKISLESNSSNIDEWDSLGHIQVMMEIQNYFGKDYVENPNLAAATSVSEIYDILKS